MSKVEMTLKEYNEMRDELLLYKRVVNLLTEPSVTEHSISAFREGTISTLYLVNDSIQDPEILALLKESIVKNMPESVTSLESDYEIEVEFPISMDIARVRKIKEES